MQTGRSSNLIGLSCWVYFDVRVHESMGHVSWNFSVCLSNGSKIDFFFFFGVALAQRGFKRNVNLISLFLRLLKFKIDVYTQQQG